jgi:hypothetical protein
MSEENPEQPEKGRWILIAPMVLATVLFFFIAAALGRTLAIEKNLKPNERFNLTGAVVVIGVLSVVSGVIAWRLIRGKKSAGGFMIPFPIIRGAGICIILAAGYLAWKEDLSLRKLVFATLLGLSMVFAETSWEWFMPGHEPEPEKFPENKDSGK